VISRVAYLSMHTSPLLQPGAGDAGGMNVYVDELARAMAGRGVVADVYTRRHHPHLPAVVEVVPGYRVIHVDAGSPSKLPMSALTRLVRPFARGVGKYLEQTPADVIHSHYWLSGWGGLLVKRLTGRPLANSFHTLGRVKDLNRGDDDPPQSLLRIAAEHEVIEGSDCLIASTDFEAADLMDHYGADPESICTSPPGIDHRLFRPGSKAAARRRLGLGTAPLIIYVGRIQSHKGVEVVVDAFATIARQYARAHLLIVGGPSGPRGDAEFARLQAKVVELGLAGSVQFLPPVPHGFVGDLYRAADVVLLPSRSESFGLVAAEAQACATPVIAARVGGLEHVVNNGVTGVLIDGWEASDYARAAVDLLDDRDRSAAMGAAGVAWSKRFSWDATVRRLLELYRGIVQPG
jgi:D-inositol-3-phosphate glycosyltransferase